MEKLDQFRPNLETTQAIKRQIIKAGISPEQIPDQWLEVMIAATAKWLSSTEDGLKAASTLFGFEAKYGNPENEYIYYAETGPREVPIKPENILFLQGVMVNGQITPLANIQIKEKTAESCEDCSIISHCTQLILNPGNGHLLRLCNNCIVNHEHPRVYDQGDRKGCEECPKKSCSHNPVNTAKLRKFG